MDIIYKDKNQLIYNDNNEFIDDSVKPNTVPKRRNSHVSPQTENKKRLDKLNEKKEALKKQIKDKQILAKIGKENI